MVANTPSDALGSPLRQPAGSTWAQWSAWAERVEARLREQQQLNRRLQWLVERSADAEAPEDRDIDAEFIAKWRAASIESPDKDEVEVRKILDENRRRDAKLKGLEMLFANIGGNIGLYGALVRRQAKKGDHDLRQELLAEIERLRARVAVLESERPIDIEEPRALRVVSPA